MKAFKAMDHPGQEEIDKFFKDELKNDKKNNRKSKKSN
jgi:hypothetical protein